MSSASTASTLRIPPLPERARVVARSLAVLLRDPGRLDQVLVMAQTINLPALGRALGRLDQDGAGRALLAERPRIDREHVDFDALARLPDGTLGREYVRFLTEHDITPDVFAQAPDVGDERAAYVMLRLRQTHDLWHVLTGYTPDVQGEILLQAFTFAQLRAPSALVLAALGSLRWMGRWKGHLRALARAFRRGRQTRFLATFRWEDHWATPVADLRAMLACPA